MNDIVKNIVNNITFYFPLKGDDFKNESLLAYNVQKFKEENEQELIEYIFRHINHYVYNVRQNDKKLMMIIKKTKKIHKIQYNFKKSI